VAEDEAWPMLPTLADLDGMDSPAGRRAAQENLLETAEDAKPNLSETEEESEYDTGLELAQQ